MKSIQHRVDNGEGFRLSLFQTLDERALVKGRNPVVIVPGYGMNSFIFSFHPRGPSFERFLAEAGFEVWRADLRGQGQTVSIGGSDCYGLEDLALTDLGVAVSTILERTQTGSDRLDIIGCSLGGTLMFIHAGLALENRIGSMVAMGSPVRWVKIHPLLRLAFGSPTLVGMLPIRGTRTLAELMLPPVVRLAPGLLRMYMNPDIIDMRASREMLKTVEDPNRFVNRQIAAWIRDKDLVLRGRNVSESLPRMQNPLLCVIASGDGIVPRETAQFPLGKIGSSVKAKLEVGTEKVAMAHADMFVSNEAHERVFQPIAEWLAEPKTETLGVKWGG